MKIRGPASAPLEHVASRLAQFSPHPRFVADIVPALWLAAERYGVDPVVMVAQSGHETGWGHFGGLVPPEFRNTCGLKIRDLSGFPNSEVTAAHAVFPDWYTGARAHAQHLLAYCQIAVPPADIVDPRWVWVFGRKPAITDVEQLGRSWAPSPTYGNRVAETAAKLKEGAPLVALMPGFTWVGGPRASGSTYIDGVPWRICLHTTETPPISRGGNPAYMAATHNTPPHIWYDWEADQGWQSVTLDRGAFALWNDGNPQTNRARCLQVELIGYAEEAAGWPDAALRRIAARVVAPLIGFVQSQGGTVDLSNPAVPLPGAIPGSASENAPQRLSSDQWLNGPIGLCTHRHVPRNDHWDAGGLDTRRIAAYVGGGKPPPPSKPVHNLTETGMFIAFGPGGAALVGAGYFQGIDEETYKTLCGVPGMAVAHVNQRGFDLIRNAAMQGPTADHAQLVNQFNVSADTNAAVHAIQKSPPQPVVVNIDEVLRALGEKLSQTST